ncbi:MAG: cell filamentation protein Fic, partial [Cyanobacteriota bacterium]
NSTPEGVIFPVSSTILNNLQKYNDCLESYSKPLNHLIDYELDDEARMIVLTETQQYYRFIDMTKMVEYLYDCITDTIEISFIEELEFLVKLDKTKKDIQELIDMPDRKINLFITICKNNNGNLSINKRKAQFTELTDEEVEKLENIYKKHFLKT